MLCTALVLLIPVDQWHPETTNDHRAMVMGFDPMLVHDAKDIPGTAVLSARKDTAAYRPRTPENHGVAL